jgi:hypothetical protein
MPRRACDRRDRAGTSCCRSRVSSCREQTVRSASPARPTRPPWPLGRRSRLGSNHRVATHAAPARPTPVARAARSPARGAERERSGTARIRRKSQGHGKLLRQGRSYETSSDATSRRTRGRRAKRCQHTKLGRDFFCTRWSSAACAPERQRVAIARSYGLTPMSFETWTRRRRGLD